MDNKIDVYLTSVGLTGEQLTGLNFVINEDIKKAKILKVGTTKGPMEKENLDLNKKQKATQVEKVDIKNETKVIEVNDGYNEDITK